MSTAEQKVPGGKLVRVKAAVMDGRLTNVNITGDFFLHPEEKIGLLENCLVGLGKDFDRAEAVQKLQQVIEQERIELIGVTPEAIVAVLQEAVQ